MLFTPKKTARAPQPLTPSIEVAIADSIALPPRTRAAIPRQPSLDKEDILQEKVDGFYDSTETTQKQVETLKMPTRRQTLSSAAIEQLIAQRVADTLTDYKTNKNSRARANDGAGASDSADGALTWWNAYAQSIGIDVSYQTPWKDLKKMMTKEYYPRNELQKMEGAIRMAHDLMDHSANQDLAPLFMETPRRVKGHYKSKCPKLKNQKGGRARGKAFVVGEGEALQDPNVVTDVPVVRGLLEVFPEDLPRLPPARQVEFNIDLVPGAAPVARSPYRMHKKRASHIAWEESTEVNSLEIHRDVRDIEWFDD
ncbi:hypothetical protein Tco_0286586 [Tanacetum coccineum]